MVKFGLLALLTLTTATTAWAQRGPASGHREYGSGTFTISCLQAGKVALQLPRVWAIEESWTGGNRLVRYRLQDGAVATFNYDSENMTCLVENWGQESVPVAARIAEEEQRKAREREALETHERLLRQAQ